jgi:Leucine-rich repeat (LRR) protein
MKRILSLITTIAFTLGITSTAYAENSYNIKRLFGTDRYKTSISISNSFNNGILQNVIIASGNDFPDALSGSALAQSLNAPVILTNGTDISIQKNYLDTKGYKNLVLLGGNSSISQDIEKNLSNEEVNDTIVTFPDKNLETIIRKSINKQNSNIYTSDVEKIIKLDNKHMDIEPINDISGIDKLTNLKELSLTDNKITNLEPLRNMTNLEELSLSNNKIANLEPLKNITNLTTLNLDTNELTDISELKNLTNLTTLTLWDNKITNIDALKNLSKLQTLSLSENEITDISPLKDLSNLSTIYLAYNRINDIAPLKELVNLNVLYLQGNNFKNITPLKNLNKLGKLILDSNEVNKSDEEQLGKLLPKCGIIVSNLN